MKNICWILCLISLFTNAKSTDEFCAKYSKNIVSQINVKQGMRHNTEYVQCKIWPANPQLSILAWEIEDSSRKSNQEKLDGDIQIVIASTQTGKIVAKYTDQGALFNDAFEAGGVKLDTALYKLNDSITAFGVRYSRNGRHSSVQNMNLYILKDNNIQKVLKDLRMGHDNNESLGGCRAYTQESKSFIIIQDKKVKNGFASLLVKSTEIDNEQDNNCEIISSEKLKKSTSLSFDGKQYLVPDGYQGY